MKRAVSEWAILTVTAGFNGNCSGQGTQSTATEVNFDSSSKLPTLGTMMVLGIISCDWLQMQIYVFCTFSAIFVEALWPVSFK